MFLLLEYQVRPYLRIVLPGVFPNPVDDAVKNQRHIPEADMVFRFFVFRKNPAGERSDMNQFFRLQEEMIFRNKMIVRASQEQEILFYES